MPDIFSLMERLTCDDEVMMNLNKSNLGSNPDKVLAAEELFGPPN